MKKQQPFVSRFIQTVEQTISDHRMLDQKERVLASVSGGPDSVAMVLALQLVKNDLDIGIAHVNHQLRGKEADADQSFTADFAKKNGLEFHVIQKDVNAIAADQGISVEEAGRDVRYAFLKSTADQFGYTRIATGHTRDDNAEQVLMNVIRGSGISGLGGIPPVRNKLIIRPFIRTGKADIIDFLNIHGQRFCTDQSNTDQTFLRNRIRLDLIPLIQEHYNPSIVDSLNRISRITRLENDYLHQLAASALDKCLVEKTSRMVTLNIDRLIGHPPALQARMIRLAVQLIKADLKRITLKHLTDINRLIRSNAEKKSLDMPGQIRIYKSKSTIMVKKEDLPLRMLGQKEKNR